MGLFSGMEKFGLGKFAEAKVIEDKKDLSQKKAEVDNRTPEEKEADVLFDKKIECPICGMDFSTKIVKSGKIKLLGKDSDLRPIYEGMDPLKYDVISCDICGYSALSKYFGKLANRQIRDVKEQLASSFSGAKYSDTIYSYDEAIERYKLALLTAIIKNGKNSEKGYICLKLAWVIRGKRLTLKPEDAQYKELYADELESIKNSYECFEKAISSEQFPIAGMNENTLLYIMAENARKLKKYEEASRYVSKLLTSQSTPQRIKDQALELKEQIKIDMKETKL